MMLYCNLFIDKCFHKSTIYRYFIPTSKFLSCLISGDDNPYKVMNDVIAKYKNFAAKWNGIMGNDHLPRLV